MLGFSWRNCRSVNITQLKCQTFLTAYQMHVFLFIEQWMSRRVGNELHIVNLTM
uniref:Uncharacterized protein n=1 Tax=Rhizophora mucronata TaxID=61149 RepID=A0A2P2P224_RHIMU